jgi:Tfp pilus assembly protein PilP
MRVLILMFVVLMQPAVGAGQSAPIAGNAAIPAVPSYVAQTAQTNPPASPPAAAPAAPQAPPENYSYDPSGRRDPFMSLLGTGTEPRIGSQRPEGAAGISVAELSVRGVMRSQGGLIAMIQGPDNRTYVVHTGDKLLDGVIKAVTPQGLVIVQEVNDPLSLVKQREVTKRLRSLEDAKQ